MNQAKIEDAPVTELVKDALDGARELVRIEVELAKDEMKADLRAAEHAAIGFGVAAAAALVALSLFAVAVVLALGGTALVAVVVATVLLAVAGGAGAMGYAALPKKPMEKTTARVEQDVQQLKEHTV